MWKHKANIWYITTIFIIILFVILSSFDTVEVWKFNDENAKRIVDSANNSFRMMLVLGILQIAFLQRKTFSLQILNVIISIFCATWSTLICKAYQGIYSLLGHLPRANFTEGGCVIGGYEGECRFTFLGYIVVALSWIIVIAHILLANKLRKLTQEEKSEKGGNEV